MGILMACNPREDISPPSIQLLSYEKQLPVLSLVDFTLLAVASQEIAYIEISQLNESFVYRKSNGFQFPTRDTLRFRYQTGFESVGKTLVYKLKVQDKKGLFAEDTLRIQVDASKVEVDVRDGNGQPFVRKVQREVDEYFWIRATSTTSLFSILVEEVKKDSSRHTLFYRENLHLSPNGHTWKPEQYFEKILKIYATPATEQFTITVRDNANVVVSVTIHAE